MNPENEIDKTEALEPVETAAANVAEARGGVDGRKRPKWLLPLIAVVCAVVLLSFVGSAGRRPLPASFRFDATVMNAVRSWARPQWMPRWPRYTLPDSRI